MAGASFPSAPSAQDDIFAELQFDYSIGHTSIPFYYRWKCTYSRSWAANSGEWSIHESVDERVVVKKLTGSQYLYVRLPSCKSMDSSEIQVIEFDLSANNPTPSLVSAGPFDTCKALENEERIHDYKISRIKDSMSLMKTNWEMTTEEKHTLKIINQYSYVSLPITIINKKVWSEYPDLAELLATLNKPTTSKEFSKLFLSRHNTQAWKGILKGGNEFPWSYEMRKKSTARSFAQAQEGNWLFSINNNEKGQSFISYKTYDKRPKKLAIYGITVDLNEEVYDPKTKEIAIPAGNESCIY
jgi:hypothetical protein